MKNPVLLKLLAAFLVVLAVSGPIAAETCVEPFPPEADDLHAADYTGEETHSEFRAYFREVEVFLNCLNAVSARVRDQARAAAYDFDRALSRYPGTGTFPGNVDVSGGFLASTADLVETGELILSFDPGHM